MKKNKMMRVASALLVAVLLTTSTISGTFAKYVTTDSATASARVAKWGVTVTATGDEAFALEYDSDTTGVSGKTVVAANDNRKNLVAPGTEGTLGGIKITGQPEVMVNIGVTADLTLTGWKITGDWDNDSATADTEIEYCPIEFTVGSETIKMDTTDENMDTIAELEAAVEAKLTALSAENVAANTDLSTNRNVTISWTWPFDGEDVKDTALGNLAAKPKDEGEGTYAPTISFNCSATVTQVN